MCIRDRSTSYGISIPVKEKLFDGMYITSTNPKVSLRMAKVDNNIIKDVVAVSYTHLTKSII